MNFPDCQYSHVSWIRKDSANYKALIVGIRDPRKAVGAVTTFFTNLTSAHQTFQKGLHPGADLSRLLQAYQDQTGIISTRHFTLPDMPDDPGHPGDGGTAFYLDLVEGIAGGVSTEVGVGITILNLVQDLVAMFNIKLHLRGLLFNTASTDLERIHFQFGPNGLPNLLPLSTTIPAAKPIMNPLDKKNYDCVGFTLFSGVGNQSLQGYYVSLQAQWKNGQSAVPVYCQYYAVIKGITVGRDGRDHGELQQNWFHAGNVTGVLVKQSDSPDGIVAIVYA